MGIYIGIMVTVIGGGILAAVAAIFRKFGAHDDSLNTQSAALAVLVERVAPISDTLTGHGQRIRETENGLAVLKEALTRHERWAENARSEMRSGIPSSP